MLRSALDGHPDVQLAANETHYFDDLRQRFGDRSSSVLPPDLAEEAADYFCSISHRPYGHHGDPAQARIDRQRLVERARELGGTADSYFQAFCEVEAGQASDSIWGEKTPRHIFRINDMLTAFPDARIVCMTRDPRAVVASYRDWRNQGGFDFERDPGHLDALEAEQTRIRRSYHPATISLLWRAQMNAAIKARDHWGSGKVFLQRYEDLVTEPERALKDLTAWLGLSFQPSMLQVPMHNSSYESFNEAQGISRAAVGRWKQKLAPAEIHIVDRICESAMAVLGYETVDVSRTSLGELSLWARWPSSVLIAAAANRDRSGGLVKYLYRRARLAFGK
jgi:hypothetical protein